MKDKKDDRRQSNEGLQDLDDSIEKDIDKDKKKLTIGIAMGTGGYRMAFHAGFIDGLKEMGIEVDQFVGTSTGALSAFLGAVGVPGYEWLDDIPPIWHMSFVKPGFIEQFIRNEVRKRLSLNRQSDEERKKIVYERLNSRLKLVSAGFPDLEPKIFKTFRSMGDMVTKLVAATSIPYQTTFPQKIEDDYFIDGFFATVFPYELPIRFLDTDIKISLRVVPPYMTLKIPSINMYEFFPRKYMYNLLPGVLPIAWMIDEMYHDGYRQAMYSRIEKLLGIEWTEKRRESKRRGEEETQWKRREGEADEAISESLENRRKERTISRKTRGGFGDSTSERSGIFSIFNEEKKGKKKRRFRFFDDDNEAESEEEDEE
jgi:predicted acylesterase/phospholipase RssA